MEDKKHTRNLVLSVCDLKAKGDLPSARLGSQLVAVGTKLYLHGGADDKQAFDDLHVLQIETTTWKSLTVGGFTKPSARYGHSLNLLSNNQLILFGGLAKEDEEEIILHEHLSSPSYPSPSFMGKNAQPWQHQGVPSNQLFLLDLNSMIWTALDFEEGPSPRAFHSSCVVDDCLYIYGGALDGTLSSGSDELWRFSVADNVWEKLSPEEIRRGEIEEIGEEREGEVSPGTRISISCCYDEKQHCIFFFGGRNDCSKVFKLSLPLTEEQRRGEERRGEERRDGYSWEVIPVEHTVPLPRVFHSVSLIQNKIIIFAGITQISTSDLYVLDLSERRWRKPLYEGQINLRVHAATILHDKLIIYGGCRDKPSLSSLSYLSSLSSLSSPASPPSSLSSLALNEIEQQRILKKLFFLSILQVREANDNDLKFKLIMLGDTGVGKSCLLTRFVIDTYREHHVATIGIDFHYVTTMVKGSLVKLQLWDTAGQERFGVITSQYYRNTDGYVLVYDCGRRSTFDNVLKWLEQLEEKGEEGRGEEGRGEERGERRERSILLIGNKYDIEEDKIEVKEEEGQKMAEKLGAVFVVASAKSSQNVDLGFLQLTTRLLDKRKRGHSQKAISSAPSGAPKLTLQVNEQNNNTQGNCAGTGCAK